MFKTKEQIDTVAERTGVPSKYVRQLGTMMSKVKLADGDLKSIKQNSKDPLQDINIKSIKQNINEALNYFEKDFLQCKLW